MEYIMNCKTTGQRFGFRHPFNEDCCGQKSMYGDTYINKYPATTQEALLVNLLNYTQAFIHCDECKITIIHGYDENPTLEVSCIRSHWYRGE